MPLQKMLEQLNIPEREAQVYLALLKQGMTSVGPIVTATKLHRQLVYQSLERLKDMRMASMVMKNGRQHWHATDPSVLLDRLEKQRQIAEQVIEELEQLRQKEQDDVHVEILYGRNGLLSTLEAAARSASKTDKIIRIIGGASDENFYQILGEWYESYQELTNDLGVKKKLIAPPGYTSQFQQHFHSESGNELRIWQAGLSTPTFNRITQEMVSIEVYGKEPIVIQIKNPTIAKSYVESFDSLWKQAEK